MAEQVEEREPSKPLEEEGFNEAKNYFTEVFREAAPDILKLKSRNERQLAAGDGGQEDRSLVYSEVDIDSLNNILNKVKGNFGPLYDREGMFVDLGSGAGKACIAAGLLHSFEKVLGMEKVSCLAEEAKKAQEAYNNLQMPEDAYKPTVELIQGDFVTECENRLVPQAQLITLCMAAATFFGQEQLDAMEKLAEAMPNGSIFITFGQKLPSRLIIDVNRSPAKRYNVAAKKALSVRGREPEGIPIVPEPPENNPNGWFQVHTDEIQLASGKSTYFIYKKIGAFFPFLKPEDARFELDLARPDQRLCASLFVALSVAEKATNLVEVTYKPEEGPEETFAFGLPATWTDPDAMPQAGVFKGMYVCDKQDCNYKFRMELLEKYRGQRGGNGRWSGGFWDAPYTPAAA